MYYILHTSSKTTKETIEKVGIVCDNLILSLILKIKNKFDLTACAGYNKV